MKKRPSNNSMILGDSVKRQLGSKPLMQPTLDTDHTDFKNRPSIRSLKSWFDPLGNQPNVPLARTRSYDKKKFSFINGAFDTIVPPVLKPI